MTHTATSSNIKKAINYIKCFHGDAPLINIVAIHPLTSEVKGITAADIDTFINDHYEEYNLYHSVNTPKTGAPNNKLKKSDISTLNGVWIDIDPDGANEELLKTLPTSLQQDELKPTYIINSGNGLQVFYLFDSPIAVNDRSVEAIEGINRTLATLYGADNVHNIDRIMRIPFTQNIPNKKKRENGRKTSLATLLYADSKSGIRHDPKTLAVTYPPSAATPKSVTDDPDATYYYDMDSLQQTIPDELKTKLKSDMGANDKLNALITGTIDKPSRSEYDFALTAQLKWLDYTIDECAQILYCYTHGKNKELTGREFARCFHRVPDLFNDISPAEIERIMNQDNPTTTLTPAPIKSSGLRYASSAKVVLTSKGILKRLISQTTLGVIYGPSNSGKSFATLDMALHIAAGKDWAGYKCNTKHPVLYLCAEAGASFENRVVAANERLGIDITDQSCPFAWCTDFFDLRTSKDNVKQVATYYKEHQTNTSLPTPGVIIIDTLNAVFGGGNENAVEDMSSFVNNMNWLRITTGATVIIVHHSGKDEAAGARGSSALRAAIDTELRVNAEKKGEATSRFITSPKQRDESSETNIAFALRTMEIGIDTDGDPITTCQLILEDDAGFDEYVPKATSGLTPTEKHGLYALQLARELGGSDVVGGLNMTRLRGALFGLVKTEGRLQSHIDSGSEHVGVQEIRGMERLQLMIHDSKNNQDYLRKVCKVLSEKGITYDGDTHELRENYYIDGEG